MKENELFELLKAEVDNEQLQFDENDWRNIRNRLDSSKNSKKKFVFIIPITKTYASTLGAVAATILAIILFNLPKEKEETKLPTTSIAIVDDKDEKLKPITHIPIKSPNADFSKKQSIVPSISTTSKTTNTLIKDLQPKLEPLNTPVLTHEKTAESSTITATSKEVTPQIDQDFLEKKNEYPDWITEEELQPKNNQQPVFFSGGGVNYQSENIGYAVKLGLDKPLSKRLSVSASLAVNTNNRNVYNSEIQSITPVLSPILSNSDNVSYDTSYHNVQRELAQTFAQALVGVNYKLFQNSKIGVGVDAFRILQSRSNLDVSNDLIINDKPTELWNFGMRLQYTQYLTRHFDVGTSYRQDISSMLNNSWQNNFLQLMIIYKVNER